MEEHVNNLYKNKLKDNDINAIKMQVFILTYLNDDKRNIAHIACFLGDL